MKYLRIHNISTHINFYQNRFINEYVLGRRKKCDLRLIVDCRDLQKFKSNNQIFINLNNIHSISSKENKPAPGDHEPHLKEVNFCT